MFHDLAAIANALIRLNMRASRHFLQKHFDWFGTLAAFKSQDTGGFVHDSRRLKILYFNILPLFYKKSCHSRIIGMYL